jgi:hypothetical protein
MSEDIQSLFRKYDAFYEVAPYYIADRTQRLHTGFDIDVYAARSEPGAPFMPPSDEYARGSGVLATVVKHASQDAEGSCSVEAFWFPSSVTFGVRGHPGEPAAMFRIRIAASSLARTAGAAENRALAEVERELNALGIARR